MKKKNIIIISLLVLIVSSITLLFFWCRKNEDVDLIKTTFKFEYGEVIEIKGKDVLNTKNASILKSFKATYSDLKLAEEKQYSEVGKYDLPIKYRINGYDKNKSIKIIVEDTKEPEFTKFSDEIEIKKGSDPNELLSYFEAKDLSTFEITLNTEKLDINQTGEYEVEVTASDKYKNKIVKKTKIIVIEEKTVVPEKVAENIEPIPPVNTATGPTYINGIMIVNKKYPVPSTYMPYENAEAGNQVRSMISEMQSLGFDISNSYSGFRSFDTQASLYQSYVNNYGQQQADTFSARPGYSEHQTGLAFDLLHRNGALVVNSPEVNWIAQNAYRYGFIVRYQAGKEYITGYQAEPWHIRYIGPLATDIYNSGLTLEEYLGAQGGSY